MYSVRKTVKFRYRILPTPRISEFHHQLNMHRTELVRGLAVIDPSQINVR